LKATVSIIIPVYNTGEFIAETIKSVENQTYKSIEVVLVDNGSTDKKTIEILKRYQNQYKVLHLKGKTVSEARNMAISESKGDFILPLDSDDTISPFFVEKCIDIFSKKPETKVVRTQVKLFGKKTGNLVLPEYSFQLLLARNLMVVTSMFKKSDWEKIGGFDADFVSGFEDWEFWINLLKDGGEVATINEPLFNYRIRKGSRNHSLTFEQFKKARKLVWEKHKALFSKYFLDPTETFEYQFITDSKAFKIGDLITKPFKAFKLMKS
jgi:glycosyltransferase involved in cell wall biosynthesis